MTENQFQSHFSPFQINAQLQFFWIFFTKWPQVAILDDRKSLSIAFLAILDQYVTFFFFKFFSKWPPAAILEVRFAPKTIRVPLCVINGYAKYEVDREFMTQLETPQAF